MTYTITILRRFWFNKKIKHVVEHNFTPDMNTSYKSHFVMNPNYNPETDPEDRAMIIADKTVEGGVPKFMTILQENGTRYIYNLDNISFRLEKDYFTLEQKRIYEESQGKADVKGLT